MNNIATVLNQHSMILINGKYNLHLLHILTPELSLISVHNISVSVCVDTYTDTRNISCSVSLLYLVTR